MKNISFAFRYIRVACPHTTVPATDRIWIRTDFSQLPGHHSCLSPLAYE